MWLRGFKSLPVRHFPKMKAKLIPIVALALLAIDYFTPARFSFVPYKSLILLVAAPLLYLLLIGEKPGAFGLSWGNKRLAAKYFAILFTLAIPVMLYGATLPEFRSYYPIYKPAAYSIKAFALFESTVFLTMLATEFFFRGFLLFGLRRYFTQNAAIFLHTIPYALAHIGKPTLEVYYSFFVGMIFAYADLKSGSILPSLALHFVSSVVFDAFVILQLF